MFSRIIKFNFLVKQKVFASNRSGILVLSRSYSPYTFESLVTVDYKRFSMSSAVNGVHVSNIVNSQKTDEEYFDSLFPRLVDDLISIGHVDPKVKDAADWYKKVNEYNVPHGKKNRGLSVLHSYRHMVGDKATPDGVLNACVIGWCIEWLQSYFLVSDDIMDSSITRRGQPCWYRQPGVGLIAVNDALHLESSIYVLLRKYIKGQPYYLDIIELFHETNNQTVIGQTLDMITAPTDGVDFTNYTLERYQTIVKYKTAFYSFYLPVAAAMYMAGISDEKLHYHAKRILLQMGEYFQIQDDYLDCFGDVSVTGKIGTDIEDNKCSWIVVQALQRASPEQRTILENNYGHKDEKCVALVREVFRQLNLEDVYREYEEQSYRDLMTLIDEFCSPSDQQNNSDVLPREMFIAYANKIYKRKK